MLFYSSAVYSKTCTVIDREGNQTTSEAGSDGNCPTQTKGGGPGGQGAALSQGTSTAKGCVTTLAQARAAAAAPAGAIANATSPATVAPLKSDIDKCLALEMIAKSHGTSLDATDSKTTSDKIATCTQKAGYTSDYASCTGTATIYNAIVAMEAVLLASQTVRNTNSQTDIQTTAAAQTAAGDGQNAIYDATLAANNFKKGLNQEQLMAYMAAVTAMGTKLASWKSGCGGSPITPSATPTYSGTCAAALATGKEIVSREITANSDAKTAFATTLIKFVSKAAAAKAAIDALNANSAIVSAAQTATADATSTFETCIIDPTDSSCLTASTTTTSTGTLSGSDYSIGDGTGTNSFDLGSVTSDTTGDAAVGDANGTVSTAASPFSDAATEAKGILDPAAAASASTGSNGSGSGGASGGMGGGGSASLGSDLSGADTGTKASEIKSATANGGYTSKGGESFRAVASSKEDNPFASLFESKGGGIEEDPSIAKDEGSGVSGLFQKISNRYQKVTADNRIDQQIE